MEQTPAVRGKVNPKDVFLHLLAVITLYVSAGALIDLLFSYVNLALPDALSGSYYVQAMQDSIRFDISLLIIVFPAYLIANWLLRKDYAAMPEKRHLRIRKWLTYLTLFLSALILIGDLVVLVNGLLHGDLAASFLLKVLAVFVVIGGIFFYYFHDVRRTGEE